jgi:protein gp37
VSTSIEWTDETWNPIAAFDKATGKRGWMCTHASPGCLHCYAEARNRWLGNGHKYRVPELEKVDIYVLEDVVVRPLRWREPRMVFVCSMTDLFLDAHDDHMIAEVFAIMALARRHTFQVLTKRAERMRKLLSSAEFRELVGACVTDYALDLTDPHERRRDDLRATAPEVDGDDWPLPNVWCGVSAESQKYADERIPELLETPAAVRFVSAEPLLGPIQFPLPCAGSLFWSRLHWVIPGGESGPGARLCNVAWIRSLVEQCQAAGAKPFVKQVGSRPMTPDLTHWRCGHELLPDASGYALSLKDPKGGDPDEWPDDLRVREMPTLHLQEA